MPAAASGPTAPSRAVQMGGRPVGPDPGLPQNLVRDLVPDPREHSGQATRPFGVGVLDVPFTLPAASAKRWRGSRRSTCLTSGPPGRSARNVGESGCHATTNRRRIRSNCVGQPQLGRHNRLPESRSIKRSKLVSVLADGRPNSRTFVPVEYLSSARRKAASSGRLRARTVPSSAPDGG